MRGFTDTIAALEVEALSFAYAGGRRAMARRAVDELSLEVHPGEFVALLGPNGSGKSTLLKIVAGLLRPRNGTVRLFGEGASRNHRHLMSVVFQNPGLDDQLSVQENLAVQCALYGLTGSDAPRRIDELLKQTGLDDRCRDLIKHLSGGLKRRVDLCRALLHQPRLVLLDEPTTGLDPAAREDFLNRIETEQRNHGLTILMTTHLVDEADRADRVVIMHQGRIVADDTPDALRARLGKRIVSVAGPTKPTVLAPKAWSRSGTGWRAPIDRSDDARIVAEHLAEHDRTFSIAPSTLADVFEDVTGHRLDNDEDGRDDTAGS